MWRHASNAACGPREYCLVWTEREKETAPLTSGVTLFMEMGCSFTQHRRMSQITEQGASVLTANGLA